MIEVRIERHKETEQRPTVPIELPDGSDVSMAHSQTEVAPLTSTEQTTPQARIRSGERAAPRVDEPPRLPRGNWRRAPYALAVLGLGLITMIGYVGFKRWFNGSNARPKIRSIAILPLQNHSADPRASLLC
jgi:hypothetical protein